MPTINATLQDLESLSGASCPLGELPQLLELVKGEFKGHDPETGELRIELNDTNRPDLWSIEGVARQLRTKRTGVAPDYSFFSGVAPHTEITVEKSVARVRPFVGGFVAEDLLVTDSLLRGLIEVQEKLCESFGQRRRSLAIGIYQASAITFPVSYRAVAPRSVRFVPLGMDEELNLAEILDQHPKGIAYREILSGVKQYPLLIDAAGQVLSFPPIINSRAVGEVRTGDSRLLVEATGTELATVLLALNILAVNMSDRGARIIPCTARYPSESATPLGQDVVVPYPLENQVTLERAEVERVLGVRLSVQEITEALRTYGCSVTSESDRLTVATPPYRLDYLHAVDAIEDYAISVGYSTFTPQMPMGFTVGALDRLTHIEDRVRDRLIGYGFEEVMTNVLTNRAAETERVSRPAGGLVEIENVMSEGYSVLRRSLIPSLLRVEAASATSLYPHRVFEVGECAASDPSLPEGSRSFSAVATSIAHAGANFSELQSYLDRLCYDIGLAYRLVPAESGPFIGGRQAAILVGDTVVGEIGEIHPKTLAAWGVRTPLVTFEIDLTQLLVFLER